MTEWISVKDRFPDSSYVYCYIKNKQKFHTEHSHRTYHLCWFDRNTKKFTMCLTKNHVEQIEVPVTHWQPLPEPPK